MEQQQIVVGIRGTQRFSIIENLCSEQINITVWEHRSKKPCDKPIGIFLDVDDVYARSIIQEAFVRRDQYFKVLVGSGIGLEPVPLPEQCHFQWSEYERIDWDAVVAGKHKASSFMIRKGISRKAQLAYYTRLYTSKNPNSILCSAIPQTYIIDTWSVWENENNTVNSSDGFAGIIASVGGSGTIQNQSTTNLKQRLDSCLSEIKLVMDQTEKDCELKCLNPPIWILKGSTTNKGKAVYIVHIYEEVIDHCWNDSDVREWVLQRYIDKPLLLDKRKFHIRAYALAFDALQVYLSRDCLALCSGSVYKRNDTSNLFSHITNTAYQDLDPNFQEDKCVLQWNDDDICSILVKNRICKNKKEASWRIQQSIDQMVAITGELFKVYENEFGVFSPIDGCFEHYGLDYIIDDQWNIYLLEVNPGPDFKQTGNRLSVVIENLMNSTIDIVFHDHMVSSQSQSSPLPRDIGNMALCLQSSNFNKHQHHHR